MAISTALKTYLTAQKVRFTVHKHKTAYTAQEIAASQHVSGKQLAKCVLVKTDTGVALAVLPAVQLIDFKKLKGLLSAKKVSLASEQDIKRAFPDVEVGAMSVFGNLYTVPTVMEQSLAISQEIVCNAGSHTDTISLRYQDVARLVKPKVGTFGLAIGKPRKPATAAKAAKKKPAKKAKKAKKK